VSWYSTQLNEHVRTQALTPQCPHLFNTTTYEETFIHRHQGPLCGSSSPLRCFEPVRLLDPVKPAHNQSRPDGRLRLTASAFNRPWISILAVLVTVLAVSQNSLHPLSASSIAAYHLLNFLVQGKITEADAPTIRLDATRSGLVRDTHTHTHTLQPFFRDYTGKPVPAR